MSLEPKFQESKTQRDGYEMKHTNFSNMDFRKKSKNEVINRIMSKWPEKIRRKIKPSDYSDKNRWQIFAEKTMEYNLMNEKSPTYITMENQKVWLDWFRNQRKKAASHSNIKQFEKMWSASEQIFKPKKKLKLSEQQNKFLAEFHQS